jgi:hypothetical protein
MNIVLNKDNFSCKYIHIQKKIDKYKINYLLNEIKLLGIPLNITDFEYIKTYNHIVIKLKNKKDIIILKEIYSYLNKHINNPVKHLLVNNDTIIIKYYGDKNMIYQKNEINISINNISIKNNCYFIDIFLLE